MTKATVCNSTNLQIVLQKFNELTKHPEHFLSCQQKESERIKTFLQNLYDYINLQNKQSASDILPNLIIDNLDEEQIWQQIEIKNVSIWPTFLQTTSKLLSISDDTLHIQYKNNFEESDNETEEDEENDSLMESKSNNDSVQASDDQSSDNEQFGPDLNKNKKKDKIKIKPSVVDDKFFKLSELESFLNSEDKREMLKNSKSSHIKNTDNHILNEEVDYFASTSSEDDNNENNINYKDFFEEDEKNEQNDLIDEQNTEEDLDSEDKETFDENIENDLDIDNTEDNLKKLNTDSESDDNEIDSDNDDEERKKSSYEQRQERLRQRIEEYEEKALGEKPWQLKGEVAGTSRPQNSLLADVLEYDSSTRPAPIITEEFNQSIEDIIRQRIKDKAWDDVVRIEKPVTTPQELRKKMILNSEKSKESLAQIYEKEYQKEIEKLTPTTENEKESHLHTEIKEMMSTLFKKLDALSNFHFTPKPVIPEPKIITNTPVINMEEVAPVSISDGKLLAPEEIKARSKGNVFGETERTKTDKTRERRHKKLRQKSIFKAKEINSLKNNNTNISSNTKTIKNDKFLKDAIKSRNVSQVSGTNNDANSFKSSKSFFSKLQDKMTTTEMKRKTTKKTDKHELSAKKLKL